MWDQFLHVQTATAMERDALHETFPIEIPGGDHVVINTSTAPIIYNKGGSILRQIESYIGQEKFKQGLRHYLKTHEYGCGASHNLWEAFEEAADLPITSMMKSWIEQEGFPIIEVKRKKDQLILTQKRFTYLPCDSDQTWLIPVNIDIFDKMGESRQVKTLLDNRQKVVHMGENISGYKVNAGQTGFYRVNYIDSQNLKELGQRVLNQTLPPRDRWGLQSDLYALVRKGAASLDSYLEFLSWYKDEDAFLPLISIAENLFQAYLVMEGAWREKVAVKAISRIEKVFATIGYEPRPNEEHAISVLRNRILWQAVLYGSEQATVFSSSKFDAMLKGDPINPDIMRSVMQSGAWVENDRAFGWFEQRFRSAESEHERQNILTAMGCFRNKDLIEKSLVHVLEEIPARNKFIPVISMASNPYAIPLLWNWFVSNLKNIEQFHPMIYEMVVTAIVPIAGIQNAKKIRAFFEDYMEKNTQHAEAIKLSLENMEINLMMRKHTC
jgi:aminopeptidase N